MSDISSPMQFATSTPQEAVDNIDGAKIYNIGADVFKDYKTELNPQVDSLKLPTEASPGVARYVSQSPEHAALAAPDVDHLSWFEKQSKLISDYVGKRRTTDQEIVDLNLKKMFSPEQFSENDDLKIFQLNEEAKNFSNYGLDGPYEQIPAQVLGSIAQMGSSIEKHAALIAGATATGAGAGFLIGGPVGALGLGASMASASSLSAITVDGIESQMGAMYNELSNMRDADGKPMNLDAETKKNLSIGVGVATGAITAVVGRGVAKTIPFLNGILGPKAATAIVSDPAKEALRATLLNIGKSVALGYSGGSIQKATEVIAKEMAKTYDGTEASYWNALSNASAEINQAGVVGGLTTGSISTVAGAAGYKVTKRNFIQAENQAVAGARNVTPENPAQLQAPRDGGTLHESDIVPTQPGGSPVQQAVDTLHFDAVVDDLSKVTKSTNMSKIAPQELNSVRKSLWDNIGVFMVHFDREDLQKFSTNEERAKDVKDMITPAGETAARMNAPVAVDIHKFLEMKDKYPEISEYVKLNPEGPSVEKAIKFLEEHKKAAEQRAEVLKKLGAGDVTPEQKATMEQALQTEQPSRVYPSNDVFGEEQYLNQPTFTEAIAKALPQGEVGRFNDAQKNARMSVVNNINDAATHEMNQIIDITADEAKTAEMANQLNRLENNPNLQIVDKFVDGNKELYSELIKNHSKKNYPPFAIDPKSLPEDLKYFAEDERLKKHQVFVKGGITADEAAGYVGVRDGETLLKILAQTPSRQEVAEQRFNARLPDIERLARESVDLNKTALAEAYNSNTANHIAEMKFMREQEWPATKAGIKRIALPLPSIEEVNLKAYKAVQQTKVGQLNANQFKVGERKSQRIAIESILKNEVEKAFVNKEAAALNSALAKETHVAIGQVNRVIRFAKKFNSPDTMQELKDAGKLYEQAANEILDVFNLNPKFKGQSEVDAYQKWAKKMIESGESNFEIPERLSDVRQSINEMTVEQTLVVGDRLKSILHMAKMKNRLFTKFENLKMAATQEAIAESLHEVAVKNPAYDPQKAAAFGSKALDYSEKFGRTFWNLAGMLDRAESLVIKLDNEQITGLYHKLIIQPLKEGEAAKGQKMIAIKNEFEKHIKAYGLAEWEKLDQTIIQVPEFKSIARFKDGKVTKGELLKMMMNIGNAGNKNRLENDGISYDTIHSVLERELDHKDMKFVQEGIWNVYESLKPKVAELHLITEGKDVRMVPAEPVRFKGRVYPGGYYPIQYSGGTIRKEREKLAGRLEIDKMGKLIQNLYSQAMTETGRLEERSGSKNVLDLSLKGIGQGFEEVVHDLHLRIPIRDTYKLLANEKISNDIASVIGIEGYSNIANMVIDASESVQMGNYSDTEKPLMAFMTHLNRGYQSVAIVFKATSLAVQPSSLFFAIDKMGGLNGAKHMLQTIRKISTNIHLWKEFYDFGANIHPPINEARENIDRHAVNSINRMLPEEKTEFKKVNITPIVSGINWANEWGYRLLETVDQMSKTIVSIASYSQALNGEAKGVPGGDHKAAVAYAQSIVRTTQTSGAVTDLSPIQKSQLARQFLFFYNDASNVYNSSVAAGRKAKNRLVDAAEKVSEGNFKGGAKSAGTSILGIMGMMMLLSASKMYENIIRGQPTPLTGPDYSDDAEGRGKFLADVGSFYFKGSADRVFESIPLVRDIDYSAGKYWQERKTVELPLGKMLSDITTAYTGLRHMLDFTADAKDVSDTELKAMLYAAGYLTHLPSDFIYKYLLKPDYSAKTAIIKSKGEELITAIDKFIKKRGEDPKIPQEYIEQLKNLKNNLEPKKDSAEAPANTLDIIKQIESKGKWNAYSSSSSAAGLYQFTEKVWSNIREQAPELGLTENGRVAKDQSQQEKAAKWLTDQNVKMLKKADLPVNTENLYAAHFLGFSRAISVLRASGDTKLKSLVGEEVMQANGFKNAMKVRDFKDWLIQKTLEAESELQQKQVVNGI